LEKKRVQDVAKELGVKPKKIIEFLEEWSPREDGKGWSNFHMFGEPKEKKEKKKETAVAVEEKTAPPPSVPEEEEEKVEIGGKPIEEVVAEALGNKPIEEVVAEALGKGTVEKEKPKEEIRPPRPERRPEERKRRPVREFRKAPPKTEVKKTEEDSQKTSAADREGKEEGGEKAEGKRGRGGKDNRNRGGDYRQGTGSASWCSPKQDHRGASEEGNTCHHKPERPCGNRSGDSGELWISGGD